MESPATQRLGLLSCLVSRDEETNLFLSHCLNFDIIECGHTADEAWENMKMAVKFFIEHCYTNYQQGFSYSADNDEWDEYACALKSSTKPPRVETIEIEMRPPLLQEGKPIWMQGVEHGASCTHVH